ncbi:hypothetical protein MUS1_06240 [Marinomonas ushuaiensis DSM 15871]|uniref:GmrSD restriction endonucleases C-terminal domain-containing protein n=1 Tax=Marinomonas ushuaiensis DSM 15871 TaxID=1122207 RepID=X7E0T4_9GAMM|nr:hypothetical protein MUS1_06240 [Marinomonas ushuaiensis DSM 15871]
MKKSKSLICHQPNTEFYSRTKNFTAFDTLQECISSGGRLPKSQTASSAVKPQKSMKENNSKYSRGQFGHGWDDVDRDCQNTRQEILISMSTNRVQYSDDKECRVISGRWISMYSGKVLFDASKVDIDHIVPLKWAWDHGARFWDKQTRQKFANDPINLVAVEASLNRSKGAKGPNEWLPPKNVEQYKLRFKRIVLKYDLND